MKLKTDFDQAIKTKLEVFQCAFLEYNSHTNLVSKNDADSLFEKHICDSLSLNLFFEKYEINTKGLKLLDIGTGGGFPSTPTAITNPHLQVTALDSIRKKINFIETIKTALKLDNLTPACERLEAYSIKNKGRFDIVTARAVSELRVICEYSAPFLKQNGYFIAFKSKLAESELKNAQNAIKTLGLKLVDEIEYELPLEADYKRVLLIFKKNKKTPVMYPRLNGQIKKSPL